MTPPSQTLYSNTTTEMLATSIFEHPNDSAPGNSTLTGASGSAVFLRTVTVMLWYTVPPVLLVFGTFGNVMIVLVMRRMRSSQSTACLSLYFMALAVSDQCLLIRMPWFWVDVLFSWPPSFYRFDLLCTITFFVTYACTETSAWFLVAMTYQRMTSVIAPHRVNVLCTVRRGKFVIALIVVIACVFNFHILFTFAYSPEMGTCRFRDSYTDFIYTFTLLDLFWASAIPFLLLIIGNAILIVQVVTSIKMSRQLRAKRSQETTSAVTKVYPMTMTLILTSVTFLLLTLPICVLDAYKLTPGADVHDDDSKAALAMADSVTFFLIFSSNATNFYLYLLSGTKFREEAKRCLGWRSKAK